MKSRTAVIKRKTRETDISLQINLDGTGQLAINTGLGFLDHMLSTLALHAGWDLQLECQGDLEVDDHHSAEDCAICLGRGLDQALGQRQNLQRFGWAITPLDEAVARSVVDLATRPWSEVDLQLRREFLGTMASENLDHFLRSFATSGRFCCHVDVLKGSNDHHKAEAAFKSLAVALRLALAPVANQPNPSTKGVL